MIFNLSSIGMYYYFREENFYYTDLFCFWGANYVFSLKTIMIKFVQKIVSVTQKFGESQIFLNISKVSSLLWKLLDCQG